MKATKTEEPHVEEKYVNLANLCQGGALELFQRELERVLENIADPNTPPGAQRLIQLQVKLKPADDRQKCRVIVESAVKLASPQGQMTELFLGKKGGRYLAVEYDPQQMGLFEPEKPHPFEAKDGGKN